MASGLQYAYVGRLVNPGEFRQRKGLVHRVPFLCRDGACTAFRVVTTTKSKRPAPRETGLDFRTRTSSLLTHRFLHGHGNRDRRAHHRVILLPPRVSSIDGRGCALRSARDPADHPTKPTSVLAGLHFLNMAPSARRSHNWRMARPALDLSQLSPDEKLDLIGELWDSLNDRDIALTTEQQAELQLRLDRLDRDGVAGRPWHEIEARLRRR
jgi:putative addiction module component (TIGR02574 family)